MMSIEKLETKKKNNKNCHPNIARTDHDQFVKADRLTLAVEWTKKLFANKITMC